MVQLTYLVMFLSLIALVAVVPAIVRRWHVPSVVAVMAIGMAIGPGGVNFLAHLNGWMGANLDTMSLYNVVDALGFLGLVFLMTLAGMEISLKMLRNEKKAVTFLSIFTFSIPAAAGYGVYWLFQKNDPVGAWVYASLFASHSIGIVFPVIRELGLARTRFGTAVLASTVITDVMSLILLAVCVQYKRFLAPPSGDAIAPFSLLERIDFSWLGNWFGPAFLLLILVYIVLTLIFVPLFWRRIVRWMPVGDDALITYFLLTVLVVVLAGELIGINLIVGAFVSGMAIARTKGFARHGKVLQRKLEGIGFGLVIPFLFLSIGFQADISVLAHSWTNVGITLATVVGLVCSKVFSGWFAMRLSGFDNQKGLCAGLMTVPQLSATLAAASVALSLEMISRDFFNAIVVLSLVTTLPVPTLVRLLIAKCNIQFTPIDSEGGAHPPKPTQPDSNRDFLDLTV